MEVPEELKFRDLFFSILSTSEEFTEILISAY